MNEMRADVIVKAKKFGPKTADHPSIGKACVLCGKPFAEGDYTTLVPFGPDHEDNEQIRNYLLGFPYNARAVEIHAECTKMMGGGWYDGI